jgi:RNA polymerase sigma-70 factor (ECF subfamily)
VRRADRPRPGAANTVDPNDAHAVSALVDELPDDQRAAFVLTQVIGCSYEEAAAACGVPIGTIRSRVARAREHLVDAVRRSETG